MDYTLSSAFNDAQRVRAEQIIKHGVEEHWSTTVLQNVLRSENLGYRRSVLIQDYEHAQVVSWSTTPEALARAEWFYRNTYQPFKEENKLNTTQIGAVMSAFRRETVPSPDLKAFVEMWDIWTEITGT